MHVTCMMLRTCSRAWLRLQEYRGRLNMMRSDMQWMDLFGEDLEPDRQHLLHIHGLPYGTRPGGAQPLSSLLVPASLRFIH